MEKRRIVIIGSGPAGYTAGIYVARAQLAPLLFAGYKAGGQLMWTTDIENYPGFPTGIDGKALMADMRQQAVRFGTTILDEFVTAVDFVSRPFRIWTNLPENFDPEMQQYSSPEAKNQMDKLIKTEPPAISTDAVIVATGASSIMLGVEGETELLGRGVSTCAVCDAAFYREKTVIVVGGGDAAMEDALALTKFAKSVAIVHRRDSFKASKIMQERVLQHEKISVKWNSSVKKIIGQDKVEKVIIETTNPDNNQINTQEVAVDGVFIAIGHRPTTQLFDHALQLDSHGYIVTRQSFSQSGVEAAKEAIGADKLVAYPTMTSVDGVFAAGDVVDIRYKQAITAAGQGCQAALDAERWLETKG